jgi:DNA-binding NtrC family response regulator
MRHPPEQRSAPQRGGDSTPREPAMPGLDAAAPDSRGPELPACMRLLSRADLALLRAPVELLATHALDVKRRWHELRESGPRSPPLSYERFDHLYGHEFDGVIAALQRGNLAELGESVRRAGLRLEGYGIPFEDVVISLAHFEASCRSVLEQAPPADVKLGSVLDALDRLSHCRIILLSDAYFRSFGLRAGHGTWGMEHSLPAASEGAPGFQGLVGRGEAMRRIFEQLIAAGRSQGSVLIRGESGTGKELAARAIHRLSDRAGAPFVAVNCAALPGEMIESELFGHRKGAFTGAYHDHPGLFRAAGAGTLLLDEVTEMSPDTQGKLLRVLQEHVVRPVGAIEEMPVSARVLASTNRDPEMAMGRGLLRRDLYYRLQVHEICMPPLRQRPEDIPLLINHYISLNNERYGREIRGVRPEVLELATRHPWPGNVRELMNVLERAFSVTNGEWIEPNDLFGPGFLPSRGALAGSEGRGDSAVTERPGDLTATGKRSDPSAAEKPRDTADSLGLLSFEDAEREYLLRALRATGWNKTRAARLLGISRKQLYAKVARFGLQSDLPK